MRWAAGRGCTGATERSGAAGERARAPRGEIRHFGARLSMRRQLPPPDVRVSFSKSPPLPSVRQGRSWREWNRDANEEGGVTARREKKRHGFVTDKDGIPNVLHLKVHTSTGNVVLHEGFSDPILNSNESLPGKHDG